MHRGIPHGIERRPFRCSIPSNTRQHPSGARRRWRPPGMQRWPAKASRSKAWHGFAQPGHVTQDGEESVSGVSWFEGLGTARREKLAGGVVTDVCGKSARRLLEALIGGEREPKKLSVMALGSFCGKIPQREVALEGQCTEHHAMLIAGAQELVDVLGRQVAALDDQLRALLGEMAPQREQLESIILAFSRLRRLLARRRRCRNRQHEQ